MKIPEQQINETTKVQEMQRDYIINIPKKEGQGLLKMCHTGYTFFFLFRYRFFKDFVLESLGPRGKRDH